MITDAERYAWIKQWFSPMGANIDGKHTWVCRCPWELLRGPNFDAAVDMGIEKTLADKQPVSLKDS